MNTKQAIKKPINEFLGITHPPPPWEGVVIPPRYDLRDNGVYREDPPAEEGSEPIDVFISAPIWVRSFEINDRGQWNVNLEFVDRVGHRQTHSVALSRLYGSATALATELGGLGLRLARSEVSSLCSYLSAFASPVKEVERKKSETEQIIESIREFILKNEDRFQNSDAFSVRSRAGYRLRDTDEWGFTKTALIEATGCHSATKAARVLVKAGLLHCNESDHLTAWRDTPAGRTRLYCVKGIILECDTPTFCTPVSGVQPQSENQTGAAETCTTSAPAPVAPFCPVFDTSAQPGRENPTNPIVMTIESSDIIAESYQASPAELDFLMTMRGKNDEPDNGGDDQEDYRAVALAAFYHEEGYPEDYPERHA